MPDSPVFEWMCAALLERLSSGDPGAASSKKLTVRGTLRLALKRSGLDPRTVSAEEMEVVLRRVLPDALERRGLSTAGLCEALAADLSDEDFGQAAAGDRFGAFLQRLT